MAKINFVCYYESKSLISEKSAFKKQSYFVADRNLLLQQIIKFVCYGEINSKKGFQDLHLLIRSNSQKQEKVLDKLDLAKISNNQKDAPSSLERSKTIETYYNPGRERMVIL